MGYLINTTRPASLLIGGTEYIDNLISFQVNDTSSYRNGIVTTIGSIVIGSKTGQLLADYRRDDFRRGVSVAFDVIYPSGTTARHPRGTLNVISASYSPEDERISIEVGCSLVMAKLLQDDDLVTPYIEIPLDPVQEDYEGVASSLATGGKILWQDSSGNLQKESFFQGDGFGGYTAGAFVSVRGVTAIGVQPLAATAAIPDEIELSYQYPVDGKASDQQGRVDTTATESTYFIKYPAITYERIKPEGPLEGVINIEVPPVTIPPTGTSRGGGCGNSVSTPSYKPSQTAEPENISGDFNITVPSSCETSYETKASPQYIGAKRREIRTTTYNGPAGQTSLTESYIYGPELEANQQYFADKYAFCVATYANDCLPQGSCELYGTGEALLGKQQTTYEFGEAREVTKTVTTTWRPRLSAAQPSDWRSGVDRGIPKDFNNGLSANGLYRHQIVIRQFRRSNNENVQLTETFTSAASRGGGIGGNIDAFSGIKTTEARRSVSTVNQELRPDSVNSATTSVESDTTRVQMHGQVGGYVNGAGPYILKEDTPVPLLYDTEEGWQSALSTYGDYLARFIEGDARGLTIGEALREQIGQNWKPNMPFRYYDPTSGNLMAFRSDGCTWGADENGCVVVMNGIWIADMTGAVCVPNNLVGAATPGMSDGAPVAPPTPEPDPCIPGGDGTVVNKRYNFQVTVPLSFGVICNPSGEDGVRPAPPEDESIPLRVTFVMWCTGRVVEPGALVSLDLDGSIPLNRVGNPVVDALKIVIDDDVMFGSVTP
jgi:hypothetical protein